MCIRDRSKTGVVGVYVALGDTTEPGTVYVEFPTLVNFSPCPLMFRVRGLSLSNTKSPVFI